MGASGESLVRVHIVACSCAPCPPELLEGSELAGRAWGITDLSVILERYPFILSSFAAPKVAESFSAVWRRVDDPCLIVDSGAFTAHTRGVRFKVEAYANYIDEFTQRHSGSLAELRFMTLDVIGDAAATRRNFEQLERLGKTVMPIVTYGSAMIEVERAAERGYFALGGLVGRRRSEVQAWLDRVFRYLLSLPELPQAHLLGVTQQWALERYPAYSVDSGSWFAPQKFGRSLLQGVDRVPSAASGDSPARAALMLESLREELRAMRALETHATALWRKRGIEWQS